MTAIQTTWTPEPFQPFFWLDAGIPDLVETDSNGRCIAWRDKTNNDIDFTQSNDSYKPTDVSPGDYVGIDGAEVLDKENSFLDNVDEGEIFVVARETQSIDNQNTSCIGGFGGESTSGSVANGYWSWNNNDVYDAFGVETRQNNIYTVTAQTKSIRARKANLNDGYVLRVDGQEEYTNSGAPVGFQDPDTPYVRILNGEDNEGRGRLGDLRTGNQRAYEIIMFDKALTLEETEKVEGYLAWRHGLEAQLPVAHPYKENPP